MIVIPCRTILAANHDQSPTLGHALRNDQIEAGTSASHNVTVAFCIQFEQRLQKTHIRCGSSISLRVRPDNATLSYYQLSYLVYHLMLLDMCCHGVTEPRRHHVMEQSLANRFYTTPEP